MYSITNSSCNLSIKANFTGNCYELKTSEIDTISRDNGEPTGTHVKLFSTGDVSGLFIQLCC